MILEVDKLRIELEGSSIDIVDEISFHIDPSGTITGVRLTKPSGNSFVDDACVDAAKMTAKLPPPPPVS